MSITPGDLRCEYLVNPLGIDSAQPRLSWVLEGAGRGQRQVAYQVRVASSAERLSGGEADLWDSGRVESAQTAHVVYAGAGLTSGRRCWWTVRVWDQTGAVRESAPAWWEMGLLAADDWQARWIGLAGPTSDALQPSPYLRRAVTVRAPVRRARIYATARGLHELYLDGQRLGDALLMPGWTDYRTRIQYQTYDVTDRLGPGTHALGAILGTGWYAGYVGYGGKAQHYGTRPQLLLQLAIEYADGTHELVTTDETWRGALGPILFSDLQMGEMYDARREADGWATAAFDAGAWAPVAAEERDTVLLVADCSEPVRVTEALAPRTIQTIGPGAQIVDMGQNMTGWVELAVQGAAGTEVRLRFGEVLNPDGTLYTANLRGARQIDTYILQGGDREVFAPHFTFHGFRYVEVSGYPGKLTAGAITGCVLGSDTRPAGTFSCSAALVEQLQHNIVWGQRGNFLSVPTDCPQRDERLGWLGDAQIFARTAAYNMDVAAFFTKWMQDVADGQSAEGAFPDVAPRLGHLSDGAPAWGDAGIIVPWTIYQQYGDTRILARHWEAMTRWMDYIESANPTLLWIERRNKDFGDWVSINATTPKEVLATAYWAYDAQLMTRMARALGRGAEAARYAELFAGITAAFNRAFVSGDGRVAGNTQTAYVLALAFDLLPEALRAGAAARLVADVAARGWHLSTGFVGVGYLLPALTQAGYAEVAYRLLLSETFPSWGYAIRHGATTIWERWDGWTEEQGFQDPAMNSFNHYALGSVGQWLYQYVAGIDTDPEQPGFARIILHPRPGPGLTAARGEYRSIRGVIVSAWTLRDGVFTLDVTIPANTTAEVYVPADDAGEVRESGQPAAQAEGVAFLRLAGRDAVFAVQSGSYTFTSRLARE